MVQGASNNTEDLVRLSFFVEIGKAIAKARTLDETLREVMHHIGQIFAPLHWSLLLRDSRTGDLTFTVVIGKNAAKLQGMRLPKGEGVAGWIAEHGQAVIVEDASNDDRFSDRIDRHTGFETKSIIGVPLKTNERVFGVIELINKLDGDPFNPFDLKILTTIADFAAIAIEKAYYLRALKRLATIDPLTGVYNRWEFERIMAREQERSRRYGAVLSCLMVDIDAFKKINDTHGHPAGDAVLQAMAAILEQSTRKVDLVFRYGGDEFVVVMPNTNRKRAEEARRRVLERLERYNQDSPPVPFSASVGLHCMEDAAEGGFLSLLDKDLYREKDKKLLRTIESMERNLEDMLRQEKDAP
jgi:diguanylate cyclase (GGDEF)-like protein